MVLGAHERRSAAIVGRPGCIGQLPAGEVRRADVAHLALVHQLVEGPERLRRWGSPGRGSAAGRGRCGRCAGDATTARRPGGCSALSPSPPSWAACPPGASAIRTWWRAPPRRAALRGSPQHRLRVAIGIGRVDEGDAGVERRVDHLAALRGVDPQPEVVGAQTHSGDRKARASESASGEVGHAGHRTGRADPTVMPATVHTDGDRRPRLRT